MGEWMVEMSFTVSERGLRMVDYEDQVLRKGLCGIVLPCANYARNTAEVYIGNISFVREAFYEIQDEKEHARRYAENNRSLHNMDIRK